VRSVDPRGRARRPNALQRARKTTDMRPSLSEEEYRSLSDQKAADFRSFAGLNPGLLAVTGAIFAAGLAQKSTVAIVLSPAPLLLAVFQLVRNAELQLQMTTYLAVFAPASGGNWERDIAEVRPRYWKRHLGFARHIRRASAWNVWVVASVIITETLVAFPWLTGFPHGQLAFISASAVNLVASWFLLATSRRIEGERDVWTKLWETYRGETPDP
jgi:hypothetical protein